MNNTEWQKVQSAIKSDSQFPVPEIEENHEGAFLALIEPSGEIITKIKALGKATSLTETVKNLITQLKEKNIDNIKNLNINLCVIKEVNYLKNPMEWDMNKDGVCFQWGDRYIGFYMPYEVARIGGDKIRILDRLCSWKTEPAIFGSAWRLPEGIVHSLKVDWYK